MATSQPAALTQMPSFHWKSPSPMAQTLAAYVQATDKDAVYVADCEEQAAAMVGQFVQENLRTGVTLPAPIQARAELEVGAELFFRREARLGIAGLDTAEGAPVRIARDPMRAAYDLLTPYIKPAIS